MIAIFAVLDEAIRLRRRCTCGNCCQSSAWVMSMKIHCGGKGRCARSWKRRPDVGGDADYPDLTTRDAAALRAMKKNG